MVRPKLAISLNAPNDDVRARVMPINRKWPIAVLLDAARAFPLRNRERITFEYVLLDHVNDDVTQARELAELLRGLRAKVNLIALNPGPGIDFGTPADERVRAFQDVLIKANSFRIGDSKFTLTRIGGAQIKTVLTDPATGAQTLETATAKLG